MLRALTLAAAAIVALGGVAASAQEPAAKAKSGRACFRVNDVRSWEGVRGGKVIIRAGRDQFFEATFIGPCPEIDMTQEIVIHAQVGQRVCEGEDTTISLKGRGSCRADLWRKLTPEEVAALPRRDRP